MLEEFIDRVVADLERVGQWPPMVSVKATLNRIKADMEREAMEKPIAPTVTTIAAFPNITIIPEVEKPADAPRFTPLVTITAGDTGTDSQPATVQTDHGEQDGA